MSWFRKISVVFLLASVLSYLILFMVRHDTIAYYQTEGAQYVRRRIGDHLGLIDPKRPYPPCKVSRCLAPSPVVFLGHLLDDSPETRASFRQLWKAVQVTCSYQAVFLAEYDHGEHMNEVSGNACDLEEDIVYFDGSSMSNLSAVSNSQLVSAIGEPLLAHFCESNSSFDLILAIKVDLSSAGVTATYLREVYLPGRNRRSGINEKSALEVFSACSGFESADTKEQYPTPYILSPTEQHPSAWENVVHSSLTDEQTQWFRLLLMQKQNTVINPDMTQIIASPLNFCNYPPDQNNDPWLVIMIHSNPTNVDIRAKIRTTWANTELLNYLGVIRLFVMGTTNVDVQAKVTNESKTFNDILQGDFVDAYHNLTLKQRLGYRFISEKCSHIAYRYVLKIDDDVMADLGAITAYFNEVVPHVPTIPKERGFYCAHLTQDEVMTRTQPGKWYITPEEYAGEKYAAYCYGGAYVLSKDLVAPLYNTSFYTRHYWVDDVYFSGFVPRNIGNITYVQLPKQDPLLAPSDPEEVILKEKKWFLHTYQNAEVFDKYFLTFDSRWNLDSRRSLIRTVHERTNFTFSMEIFDYL